MHGRRLPFKNRRNDLQPLLVCRLGPSTNFAHLSGDQASHEGLQIDYNDSLAFNHLEAECPIQHLQAGQYQLQ
jgi:hypothetical protein